MAIIIHGSKEAGPQGNLDNAPDFGYKYPGSADLNPKEEGHKRLLSAIQERIRSSYDTMATRYPAWQELDKTLTSYIPLDEEELEEKDKDPRKPFSIVVPTSYATLETLLTYLVQAFFDSPIFRYNGVGSEDVFGAMLLEQLVHRQAHRGQMGIALHTMLRNSLTYGIGPVTPIWEEEEGYRTVTNERGYLGKLFGRGAFSRKRERAILFEGNRLYAINPYKYFPDTSVASHDVQDMEFVGWLRTDNRMNLLSDEKLSDGDKFNARYLDYIGGLSVFGGDESERDRDGMTDAGRHSGAKNAVDLVYLYWNLVPSEWGLSDDDYPEKWLFCVAGDQLILQAHPLRLDHQMFPVVSCAPDSDGFSATPISKMETIHGLQTYMNFLYNSHATNIRKAIHDMLVVDPGLINMNDVLNPGPGRLIRTRKKSWGTGVKEGIVQLDVSDLTQNHVQEGILIDRFIERSTGASDFLQGILRGGERRTAEEVRTVSSGALSRLERMATMCGIQAFQPLGYMIASQTQQFLSQEHYVDITGRNEADLRAVFGDVRRALATPMDISVDYDVEVSDGTLANQGSPDAWIQLYQMVLQNPEATQGVDTLRLMKYIAKLLGAKNVEQFDRQQAGVGIEVRPDDAVLREVERGNLVAA